MRGAILCGQNSLPIFCLGVLLTIASHMALFDISEGPAMHGVESPRRRGDDRDCDTAEPIRIKPRQRS
jgi:hypothetical protein